jgi:hypothetical protein
MIGHFLLLKMLMRNKPAFAMIWVFLILSVATSAALPQSQINKQSKNPITEEEITQAQELSKRFIQRFQETRDLTPIIEELFTSNFKKTIEQDSSWGGMVGQGDSLVEHLNARQRLRCFIVSFNFEYLMRLYIASRIPLDNSNAAKTNNILPAKIAQFFRDKAPRDEERKSTSQVGKYLAFLEQAMILIQEEVRQNPPEITEQFKKNLSAFESHLTQNPLEKPLARILATDQYGFPVGTRLSRTVIPFHVGLLMVKEGNTLKLYGAATNLPPD